MGDQAHAGRLRQEPADGPARPAVVPLLRDEGQARLRGGLRQRLLPLEPGGVVDDPRGGVADGGRAPGREVGDHEAGGLVLVDVDGVDVAARRQAADDAGRGVLADRDDLRVGQPRGDEDQAEDPHAQQAVDGALEPLLVLRADGDEGRQALLRGGVVEGPGDLLEEGVAEVGQDQADGRRAPARQGGGRRIDPVAEGARDAGDMDAGLLGDLRGAAQREGDQAARHPGGLGDVGLRDVVTVGRHGAPSSALACGPSDSSRCVLRGAGRACPRWPRSVREPISTRNTTNLGEGGGRIRGLGRAGGLSRTGPGRSPRAPPARSTWSRGRGGSCRSPR